MKFPILNSVASYQKKIYLADQSKYASATLINGWRRPETIQRLDDDALLHFPWIRSAEHHGTALGKR
jgi:hypothetical protein